MYELDVDANEVVAQGDPEGIIHTPANNQDCFDFDGPHRLIDVTSIAPRVCKVRKVPD